MSNISPENFIEELTSRLSAAGLTSHLVNSFVERYREYQNYNTEYFQLFENHQMPSDDCFRTLEEAYKILVSKAYRSEFDVDIYFICRYLKVPYSNVVAAKRAMSDNFDCSESDIEAAYYQDPEWLFINEDTVRASAAFLRSKFSDRELVWSIYTKAALLGLEKTQYRINKVLEFLGAETGEKVIRNDLKGEAWLFYLWFTDPVGCIKYMLECGLNPEKVQHLLECEPRFLFEYKEGRKLKYHHNQDYIDFVIHKFAN